MSGASLRAALEHICGLPAPAADCENEMEQWAAYEVASNLMLQCRFTADPEQAKIEAIAYTLKHHAWPLEMLAPHLERVMGRKLLPQELADGTLYE